MTGAHRFHAASPHPSSPPAASPPAASLLAALLLAALLLAGHGVLASGSASAAPPHYDNWVSFTTVDGLPSDKVLCVLATDDAIWAGTDKGVAVLRDSSWSTLSTEDGLVHQGVLSIAQDESSGEIWIATMGGLSRYSAGRIDNYTQFDSGLVNDVVYSVDVHKSEVWAATAAGTSRYVIAEDRWSIYDETNTSMHEIWCYSTTGHGDRVYVGVWGGGLLEYSLVKDRWKHYSDPDGEMEIDLFLDDGLVHDIVTGVTVDEKGIIWVGTYFGLSSYDERSWASFLDHDTPLRSNFINYVVAERDECWIATDNGLNACDRENWWTYIRDDETGKGWAIWNPAEGDEERIELDTIFPHNYTLGLSFQGDYLWVSTEAGLARGKLTERRAENATPQTDPSTSARSDRSR